MLYFKVIGGNLIFFLSLRLVQFLNGQFVEVCEDFVDDRRHIMLNILQYNDLIDNSKNQKILNSSLKHFQKMKKIMNLHFITLFIAIILCGLIFVTKYDNVASAKVNTLNTASAVIFVNIFVGISFCMLGIQLLFTILGLPFLKTILPLQVLLQILAVVSLGCYILFSAHYAIVSYIWGFFVLIPFGLDIASRISGAVSFRKYNSLDLY